MYSRRHSPALLRSKGPTRSSVETFIGKECSPAGIRPLSIQTSYCFDPGDPVVRFELSRSERRDHFEHLVGESSDVQDVRALGACVVWFGWMSRQTRRAFGFRCRNSDHSAINAVPRPRPCIHPRLVIRDEDDEVRALSSRVFSSLDRSAAVRSAAADRSQLPCIRHHAIARVQIHRNNCLFERQHGRG